MRGRAIAGNDPLPFACSGRSTAMHTRRVAACNNLQSAMCKNGLAALYDPFLLLEALQKSNPAV